MRPSPPLEGCKPEQSSSAQQGAGSLSPLDVIRVLRASGSILIAQAALHGQLARVDWVEEKRRLTKMIVVTVLGCACMLCAMLLIAVLVLALSWDTVYRVPCVVALIAAYVLSGELARRRIQALSALGASSFAATRAEFAADIALIKSRL
jgi:uncharacterized membrane protein YqjE